MESQKGLDPHVAALCRWIELREQGREISVAAVWESITGKTPDQETLRQLEAAAAQIERDEAFLCQAGSGSRALAIAREIVETPTEGTAQETVVFRKTGPADNENAGASAVELPATIGRYRIKKLLGTGGFGAVYLAEDPNLARPVAIKAPKDRTLEDRATREKFLEEGRTLAGLKHPAILRVYDAGITEEGTAFVVSEFIEGEDLAARMQRPRPSMDESVRWVAAIAEGLNYAHSHRLVHRDVKPRNILIDQMNAPYLVDFGLALRDVDYGKLLPAGGTLLYLSPEQAQGKSHLVDNRSDIFSLGVVLYELLAGERPFRGQHPQQVKEAIMGLAPRPLRVVNPSVPKRLEEICLKAIEKDPAQRYATAADFAADLRAFLRSAHRKHRPGRFAAAAACVAVLVALGGLLAWGYQFGFRAPAPASQPPTSMPAATAFGRPTLTVKIWNSEDASRQALDLSKPGALPLRKGDRIGFIADLKQPRYAYLLEVDSTGAVTPLYPWRDRDWGKHPVTEAASERISLPEEGVLPWAVTGNPGTIRVLLLVSDEPLPPNVDLEHLFQPGPLPALLQHTTARWFKNGLPVSDPADEPRAMLNFNSPEPINDPIWKVEDTLYRHLRGNVARIISVWFSCEGG